MNIKDLNVEIMKCYKCRLSETRKNALCGEGNTNAKLMLIAQAPGEKEDRDGKMFIGPSGKVLDELLDFADIKRKDVYMTNLIKCKLPGNRRPKQDEIKMCGTYLDSEIKLINPSILVPLGYYATKYVFEKYALRIPPKEESYSLWGRLYLTYERKVFPVQHPSAILHNPGHKNELTKNYCKLRVIITECKWYQNCPMKRFYEEGNLSREWIELYCKGDWQTCVRFQMEEKGETHPDWMLQDGSIDETLYELYYKNKK